MISIPTLSELMSALSFLGEMPAAWVCLATALILLIINDWRLSIVALTLQYVVTGWILASLLQPEIAMLKILVGLIICLILLLTARQSDRPIPAEENSKEKRAKKAIDPGIGLPFRLIIGLLTATVILRTTGSGTLSLPELPVHTNLASVSLMLLGLLSLGLTEKPLKAGFALLTVMMGFEIFYHSLEQAITVIGFLVAVDFGIAIIASYLSIAHNGKPEKPLGEKP